MANKALTPAQWVEIDKYLQAGSNGVQIAELMGVSIEQLYEQCKATKGVEFCTYLASKWEEGNSMIRVKQFGLAMGGDKQMLMWLGKERLGQGGSTIKGKTFNQMLGDSENPNIINLK